MRERTTRTSAAHRRRIDRLRALVADRPRQRVADDDPAARLQELAVWRAADQDEALPLAFARVADDPAGRALVAVAAA